MTADSYRMSRSVAVLLLLLVSVFLHTGHHQERLAQPATTAACEQPPETGAPAHDHKPDAVSSLASSRARLAVSLDAGWWQAATEAAGVPGTTTPAPPDVDLTLLCVLRV